MENNLLLIAIVAAVVGIVVGAAVVFFILNRKLSNADSERVRAETRSAGLNEQIRELNVQNSELKAEDSRKQNLLIEAERARSAAETQLTETTEQVESLKEEVKANKADLDRLRDANTELGKSNAELTVKYDEALKAIEEQKQFLADANKALKESFESLSSQALRTNNTSFLELAKETLENKLIESKSDLESRQKAIDHLVKPLSETLTTLNSKVQEIEVKREGAYSEMKTLLEAMKGTTERLNDGTTNLVSALKTSHVRGRYGEIGLKRIVEASGMSEHCDFEEQVSVDAEDCKLRPDMTVTLPGQRQLILDAKVPLSSYMKAFETVDEDERNQLLIAHAKAVRDHLKKLGQKTYWDQFKDAPDFVIMYLQIESSFGAALMHDHDLIDDGIRKNVVIATPSTLITMLRTVGFVWQQEKMARNILDLRDAGLELYKRTATLMEHFSAVGKGLGSALSNYNKAVGSFDSSFMPSLNKMKDIGGNLIAKEMPEVSQIDITVRTITKQVVASDEPLQLPGGTSDLGTGE